MINEEHATFWQHVEILRETLLRIVAIIFFGFILSFIFHKPLLQFLTHPTTPDHLQVSEVRQKQLFNPSEETTYTLSKNETLLNKSEKVVEIKPNSFLIPKGESLQLTYSEKPQLKVFGPLEGMVSTLKTSLWTSLSLTSPIWLFLILTFIAPAFKREVSRLLLPFWALSILLFFAGLLFAWKITLPWANSFLQTFNNEIGENLWGFGLYLDYTLTLLLSTGLAFESAIILLFLVHFGNITTGQLKSKRRHAVVGIFILSAILTPPDVLTQLLLAIPLMGLYEVVILYSLICERRRTRGSHGPLASSTINLQHEQTLPKDL